MAQFYLLAALAVLVSVITLASFLKFQRYAFYNEPPDAKMATVREVPFPMLFSMIALGVICLLLSILAFPGIRDIVLTPATDILMGTASSASQITGL